MEECLLIATKKKTWKEIESAVLDQQINKIYFFLHTEEWQHFSSELHQSSKQKKESIPKQALMEFAHKYNKLSHTLSKIKHTWFGKQLTSFENWYTTEIQRWTRKAKKRIRSNIKHSLVFPLFSGIIINPGEYIVYINFFHVIR